MPQLKSTTIVPIAFYCFLLGFCLLYFAVNTVMSSNSILSSNNFVFWLPAAALAIFGCGFLFVGAGILHWDPLSWRILFFTLAITVSCMTSLIVAFIIFLFIDIKFLDPYFQAIQTTSLTWFIFLSLFLSEIVVLYYLSRDEVASCFGGMPELVAPF